MQNPNNAKNNFSKDSYEIVKKFRSLDFVVDAHVFGNPAPINKHNFENTLIFNKNNPSYTANIRIGSYNYKIKIIINGNRPNPCYEKKLKKLF